MGGGCLAIARAINYEKYQKVLGRFPTKKGAVETVWSEIENSKSGEVETTSMVLISGLLGGIGAAGFTISTLLGFLGITAALAVAIGYSIWIDRRRLKVCIDKIKQIVKEDPTCKSALTALAEVTPCNKAITLALT